MLHAIIPSDEFVFAEDALISNAQFVIHNLMADRGMTRAELARALHVSDARVSQMFSDSAPNLTLKTLARVFRVLGEECRITSEGWEKLLASAAGEEDNAAKHSRGAGRVSAFDFESMLRSLNDLESASQDAYSNDNSQVAALAA